MPSMKLNKLHSMYILFLVFLCTGYTCVKTVIKSCLGKLNKDWCDAEIQRWIKRIIKLVQAECQVMNPHHIASKPGQPTIIMCNHTSLFDIPLTFWAFPNESIRMLAKHELFKIPFFGKAMMAAGFPKITRNNRRQAFEDLAALASLLQSGIVLWVAPEGTRSKTGHLGAFKKGAFITAINAGATIIPIAIRGANLILPAKTLQLNLRQSIEIHVGEPIDASRYGLEDKDKLIEETHERMDGLLGGG